MSPRALFVYYKVDSAKAATLRTLVINMQNKLRQQHPQLLTQLMVRVDEAIPAGQQASPMLTWMEVYHHPAGIDAGLHQAIEYAAHGVGSESCGQIGPRHIEVFAPCA